MLVPTATSVPFCHAYVSRLVEEVGAMDLLIKLEPVLKSTNHSVPVLHPFKISPNQLFHAHRCFRMLKISLTRQCLSHLAVAAIFFQLGTMSTTTTSSTNCVSLGKNTASRSEDWDVQLNQRRIRKSDDSSGPMGYSPKHPRVQSWNMQTYGRRQQTTSTPEKSQLIKDFVHGMAWIPRDEFVKTFDTGVAIDNAGVHGKNSSVLLLYANQKSLPKQGLVDNQKDPVTMLSDPLEATENCNELQIIIASTKRKNRCIAIMENWGGSPHMYRFLRYDDSKQLRLGGRFFDGAGGANRWQKVRIFRST